MYVCMCAHTYRYTKQGLFLLFLLPFNATQAPSSSPNSLLPVRVYFFNHKNKKSVLK